MAECKYCGKEIQWITTVDGKSMPCELPQINMYKGDQAVLMTKTGRLVRCNFTGNDMTFIGYGYKPH